MSPDTFLRIAYIANIAILAPVVPAMLFGAPRGHLFGGDVADSEGLRILVGALWASILLASMAGLVWPQPFWPLLAIQIVYKALWLGLFVLPLWTSGGAVPWGIAAIFAFIVAVWPILLWLGARQVAVHQTMPA